MTDTRTPRAAGARAAETADLPAVTTDPDRSVTVNGVTRPWTQDVTVAALVADLLGDAPTPGTACAPTGVAVALDDAIVPRGLWESTPVPAGARVEVVTAVQGG
ncbi:sulfur carrier protein ThiS [Cellulomonas xiejunii]|uniref:Sulfur carrier protein ThiS n=1 Tax=Cellulomonas xiejunii TaxID=2968083 RepID=A0ABY5KPK9_9CELL|nr:sulfur carrier protein ThiS [Cellulomonas xiejunii]MCC2322371.1 sulfur carrier protein ThiS [Cellulomonas xiejunii]UUI72421.1 sulfur carrier protein ThiS [Cellulomonas xiejunii]